MGGAGSATLFPVSWRPSHREGTNAFPVYEALRRVPGAEDPRVRVSGLTLPFRPTNLL